MEKKLKENFEILKLQNVHLSQSYNKKVQLSATFDDVAVSIEINK